MSARKIGMGISLLVVIGVLLSAPDVAAKNVYVLKRGDAWDTALQTALTLHGHTVTLGSNYNADITGTVDLSPYDVVIWYGGNGSPNNNTGFVLLDFVNSGRGLITLGWLPYYIRAGNFGAWTNMLPGFNPDLGYDNTSVVLTYSNAVPDPILTTGLTFSASNTITFPISYEGGDEDKLVPRPGATNFFVTLPPKAPAYGTYSGNPGLVGWQYGQRGDLKGRVLSFSALGGPDPFGNANFARLFANAVNWVAPTNTPLVAPRPVKVYVMRDAGNGTHDPQIRNFLGSVGFVTNVASTAKRPDQLTSADLDGFDVVVADGCVDHGAWNTFSPGAVTALTNLFARGGGLIVCGWITYYNNQPFLPGTEAGYDHSTFHTYSNATYDAGLYEFVLFTNTASSFRVQPVGTQVGSTYSLDKANPKAGATNFMAVVGNYGLACGLLGWNYGGGRVLQYPTFLSTNEFNNPSAKQLMINSVMWVAPPPPPPPRGTVIYTR